jgi:hypothetical protein
MKQHEHHHSTAVTTAKRSKPQDAAGNLFFRIFALHSGDELAGASDHFHLILLLAS